MHIVNRRGERCELELLPTAFAERAGVRMLRSPAEEPAPLVSRAARAFFQMLEPAERGRMGPPARAAEPPALFRDTTRGLLRMVYKEAVIRFRKKARVKTRQRILEHGGFRVRRRNPFVREQLVVYTDDPRRMGAGLLEMTNEWMEMEEVEFCTPNFVSEYKRFAALPTIRKQQWHLENRARYPGQVSDEDVDARRAWRRTLGRRSITVAVLDDGVDVEHPNLKRNIKKSPDPAEPRDKLGRDFFIPNDDHPEHYNPRPKVFNFPFDQMAGNDIHGTPCAGVIAGDGRRGPAGIAPRCKILPVKIFHADFMASDARVADAIRYAALHADVLSCSWGCSVTDDIELAVEDARTLGRGGRGAAVFFAAGNEHPQSVSFPASLDTAMAVAASTDQAERASYSCTGPELTAAAPSDGGVRGITTTDLSNPDRGFALGSGVVEDFGGTSSATPLAAGVAALMLSVDKSLAPDEVRDVLIKTCDKIGPADGYDANGFSPEFGFGRVNAARALEELA